MNSYKSHEPSPGKKCIHALTWSQIAAQSRTDPTVFSECLENGCTHAVELKLNSKLKKTAYPAMTGDGTGMLRYSIQDSYLYWNAIGADTVSGSSKNAGGWPASRIRATLCGADERTDSIDIHPDTQTGYAGSGVLTEAESLLSCFPVELQSAVVAKEVRSDTVYHDITGNTQTTYDRLWLYSVQELYGGTGDYIRPNEGTLYQRQVHLGIDYSSNYAPMTSYDEDASSSYNWLLRSASRYLNNSACSVNTGGCVYFNYVYSARGLAPGFCVR